MKDETYKPGIWRLHWEDGTFSDIEGTSLPNALNSSGILPESGYRGPPENLLRVEKVAATHKEA